MIRVSYFRTGRHPLRELFKQSPREGAKNLLLFRILGLSMAVTLSREMTITEDPKLPSSTPSPQGHLGEEGVPAKRGTPAEESKWEVQQKNR